MKMTEEYTKLTKGTGSINKPVAQLETISPTLPSKRSFPFMPKMLLWVLITLIAIGAAAFTFLGDGILMPLK